MGADTHQASERRFLDERGSSAALAPNGLNPATILEKAVRERIVASYFWLEQCHGLNEADVVDRVVDHVTYVGGVVGDAGSQRPSPFLCLAFKLLQLGPGDDVVDAYLGLGGERFKYLRALAAFYVRLTRPAKQVYRALEPLLADRRKLRRRGRAAAPTLGFVDAFVDDLLVKDRVCATSLWQMPKREVLEEDPLDPLDPRESPLGDIEDLLEEEEEEEREKEEAQNGKGGGGKGGGGAEDDDDGDVRMVQGGAVDGDGDADGGSEDGQVRDGRRRPSRGSRTYSRSPSYSRRGSSRDRLRSPRSDRSRSPARRGRDGSRSPSRSPDGR